MTSREAREILKTYRPGIDFHDPAFHEAVAQARRDPDLAAWVRNQDALYQGIRSQLKDVPVPEDLAAKILTSHRPRWSGREMLQLAAAVAILAAVAAFWLQERRHPATFADYRTSMAALVSKKYPMGLETPDLERARKFLANNQSPSDYVLPAALKSAPLLGCATLSWGANPVSLLCFRQKDGSGLWLFVTEHPSLRGLPASVEPEFSQTNGLITAGWRDGGKIYLMASLGGPDRLAPYLRE
ncbi:MAG: hypothetical protein PHC88_06670 [Terrimicrobiaceae bacterium]|nr:hypothetical protein [Terrimicrobiaceae bacterium]